MILIKESPMISIVIPVYNGSNYLNKAIDSALSQTYENYEVLVVNDGSNDGGETERIALRYGSKIRYFSKENGGVASALNLALREMRGEYFSWLSHDDFYYPQKLQKQMDALKACGNPARIVISDYNIYYERSGDIAHFHMRDLYDRADIENSVFSILQGLVGGCSMLIHKSHFQRVGGFDENLRTTQDYDLWFRMFRGQHILHVPECVMAVRIHPNQGINRIPSHKEEQSALYIKFMKSLADDEIISMYGARDVFYSQISSLLCREGVIEAYRYANDLLQAEPVSENMNERLQKFHDHLSALSDGKAKQICIFCAGNWGIRLYNELICRRVRVDFFCDNDPKKNDLVLGNIRCIPLEELQRIKDETLVIVSTARPDSIIRQLAELGFHYVTKKQDLSKYLSYAPRIKADRI